MVKKTRKEKPVCRDCDNPSDTLSRKGLCPDCGEKRSKESIRQMVEKEGELYDKWFTKISVGIKRTADKRKVKDNE